MKNKFSIVFLVFIITSTSFAQFLGGSGSGYSNITYAEGPLPVELISFTASLQDVGVLLYWSTASEIDNYGFEVERKNSNEDSSWELLSFVIGNGTSSSKNEYNYYDNKLNTGSFYYRLKQIDNDGKYEYSNEIFITIGVPNSTELEQNYPNPFNPTTNITFNLSKLSFVKLSVYNIIGEEISVLINELKESGYYSVNFDASNLNSGIYLYKLEADGMIKVNKMQLLK